MRRLLVLPLALAGQLAWAAPPPPPAKAPPPPAKPSPSATAKPGALAAPAAPAKPGAPAAPAASASPSPAAQQKPGGLKNDAEFQMAVYSTINGSSAAIDACTKKYTDEFPDRKGQADIALKAGADGRVTSATVNANVQAPDRLKECLSAIARYWRFPKGPFEMSFPVPVAKGVKLTLKKPGDNTPPPKKAEPAKEAPKQDEGFIKFTPGWTQE